MMCRLVSLTLVRLGPVRILNKAWMFPRLIVVSLIGNTTEVQFRKEAMETHAPWVQSMESTKTT